MKRTCLTYAAGITLLAAPGLQGQASVITGRVFDSLKMAPFAGVKVQLSGTALLTRTSGDGTYRLVTGLRGKGTLTFSEPRLDRFLGTVTSEVELTPGSEVHVDLAIPRQPLAPSDFCAGGPPQSTARGGVVGVVRDSATGLAVSGALVAAYWTSDSDTVGVGRGVQGESSEDGSFLLCNLPTDRSVSLVSRTQGREASLEGLRPSSDTIADVDLLLRALAEAADVGRLRGRVIDSATGAGLAGADIMLTESGLHAISNASGDFLIDQVLPGRTAILARRIGYRPEFFEASLTAGGTATVVAILRPAPVRLPELETRIAGALEREGFVERRRAGMGKYWDEPEIRRFDGGTLTAVLGLKVNLREDGGVLMNHSRSRTCAIPVVVNGVLWTGAGDLGGFRTLLRPEQLAAVEYYAGPAQVPMEFQSLEFRADGFRCGLLVVWTRGRV